MPHIGRHTFTEKNLWRGGRRKWKNVEAIMELGVEKYSRGVMVLYKTIVRGEFK
jgi:hypothetical protein